jgi:hypothetical protein
MVLDILREYCSVLFRYSLSGTIGSLGHSLPNTFLHYTLGTLYCKKYYKISVL